MVATLTEIGMGRAVIEAIPVDGSMALRVFRVPTASVTHYALWRSKARTGFDGDEGDDDTGLEEIAPPLAQPGVTAVFGTMTDTLPDAVSDFYYRVRATDNATPASRTEMGEWSNVVMIHRIGGNRHITVPTWPSEMRPNHGVLAGLVTELQDADDADGMTWLQLRQAQASAVDEIQAAIADAGGESSVMAMFRDPPAALRQWFQWLSLALALPTIGLPVNETRERLDDAYTTAARWRKALMDDVTVRLPGGDTQWTSGGRIVR